MTPEKCEPESLDFCGGFSNSSYFWALQIPRAPFTLANLKEFRRAFSAKLLRVVERDFTFELCEPQRLGTRRLYVISFRMHFTLRCHEFVFGTPTISSNDSTRVNWLYACNFTCFFV